MNKFYTNCELLMRGVEGNPILQRLRKCEPRFTFSLRPSTNRSEHWYNVRLL